MFGNSSDTARVHIRWSTRTDADRRVWRPLVVGHETGQKRATSCRPVHSVEKQALTAAMVLFSCFFKSSA